MNPPTTENSFPSHVFSARFTGSPCSWRNRDRQRQRERKGERESSASKTNGRREAPRACQWPRAKIAETASKHGDGFSVVLLDFW